jgi:hypothetical protein
MVTMTDAFEPAAENSARYDEAYGTYRAATIALDPLYAREAAGRG